MNESVTAVEVELRVEPWPETVVERPDVMASPREVCCDDSVEVDSDTMV